MSSLADTICWAVVGPLPAVRLSRIIRLEWNQIFPEIQVDPAPWQVVTGSREYNAIVCDLPGSEGSDRPLAEAVSRASPGRIVYSLWFDPDRWLVFQWKDGREVSSREAPPFDLAAELGFETNGPPQPRRPITVAVVEGVTPREVETALGTPSSEIGIDLSAGPAGVLVTADDGLLGSYPWDIAESLPTATVYYLQWRSDPDEFVVLVLRGSETTDWFQWPMLDDGSSLSEIKGASTPSAICEALGVPLEQMLRHRGSGEAL